MRRSRSRSASGSPTDLKRHKPTSKSVTAITKKKPWCCCSSTSANMRPSRKARTKIKKPKFLSLRLELNWPATTHTSSATTTDTTTETATTPRKQQLILFPLHPENTSEEKPASDSTIPDHENIVYFFSVADGGPTSLMGLLNVDTASEVDDLPAVVADTNRGSDDGASDHALLLRSALKRTRGRSQDEEEEKWVCMSEVVEQSKEDQEVSSYRTELWRRRKSDDGGGGPVLKLDYVEVMNAWSDKGPLFLEAPDQQESLNVPDFYDDFLFHDLNRKQVSGLWTVPKNSFLAMHDEIEGGKACDKGQREASVLRYKKKRESRLFSKRIRYEVRKLNAQKRPRVKGRFVKSNKV